MAAAFIMVWFPSEKAVITNYFVLDAVALLCLITVRRLFESADNTTSFRVMATILYVSGSSSSLICRSLACD